MEASPFECIYPEPGWVEQDPQLHLVSQLEAARRLLEKSQVRPSEIVALGITDQRETTVVWDRVSGEPVAPAIVWQCRRTADYCSELVASGAADRITQKTGLVWTRTSRRAEIRWILHHVPEARQRARSGDLLFGNVDSWLIWKLTNGACHATDFRMHRARC